MKAMTCPQCGALIRKISLREKFAECEYCDARILLADNRDRIVEVPDETKAQPPKNLSPWEQYRENYRKVEERAKQYDAPHLYPEEPETTDTGANPFSGIVILGVIAVFVGGIFVFLFGSVFAPPEKSGADKKTFIPTPFPTIEFPETPPPPRINYQVKVQWNGANDMEHFENPVLRNEDLPTLDENELKKTVFKNREVKVKVTIGTDGEVKSAEGISGHPVLKKTAVEAARKTLFNPRAKPATRILTYYFRLVTD